MNKIKSFIGLFLVVSTAANAKVYVDAVEDAIPLVEISIVLPRGMKNSDIKNFAAAKIVDEILESGTKNKTKQELNDSLAAFGANLTMSIGNEYSYLNIGFPYLENKDYSALFKIIHEAFHEPRFDKPTFDLAKKKLRSSLTSLLDSDAALVSSMIWDWQYFKSYNQKPMTIEDVEALSLEQVKDFYFNKFLKTENAWVGLVAPKAAKQKFIEHISGVLKHQGDVVEGIYLKPLIDKKTKEPKVKPSKTFLAIDKSGRTQNVFAINAMPASKIDAKDEFDYRFANFLLIGASFGSVFYDVIRNQNGFAYSVSSFDTRVLGSPTFGFMANPVANRAIDAFKVMGDLVERYYENSKDGFGSFDEKLLQARLQSYKYSAIMSRSTEIKKLSRRKNVILGEFTAEYYNTDPKDWVADKKGILGTFDGLYKNSQVVAAAVGNGEAIESLVKLNFPDFTVIKIPYQDVITAKPFQK